MSADIDSILNRIKIALDVKTDVELSLLLKRTPSTISNWRDRKTIDYDLVIEKCEKYANLDWIFLGRGSKEITNEQFIIKMTEWFKRNIESIFRGDDKWKF